MRRGGGVPIARGSGLVVPEWRIAGARAGALDTCHRSDGNVTVHGFSFATSVAAMRRQFEHPSGTPRIAQIEMNHE